PFFCKISRKTSLPKLTKKSCWREVLPAQKKTRQKSCSKWPKPTMIRSRPGRNASAPCANAAARTPIPYRDLLLLCGTRCRGGRRDAPEVRTPKQRVVVDPSDKRLPEVARACLAALGAQLRMLKAQILEFDRMIRAWHRSSETSRRLDHCPGVGPVLATALVASVADPKSFRSGRNFSAWIGLVPKQHSSGG